MDLIGEYLSLYGGFVEFVDFGLYLFGCVVVLLCNVSGYCGFRFGLVDLSCCVGLCVVLVYFGFIDSVEWILYVGLLRPIVIFKMFRYVCFSCGSVVVCLRLISFLLFWLCGLMVFVCFVGFIVGVLIVLGLGCFAWLFLLFVTVGWNGVVWLEFGCLVVCSVLLMFWLDIGICYLCFCVYLAIALLVVGVD